MRPKLPTFLTAILTVLVIFLLLSFYVFSPNKIAYVDSARLLNGYKAMVEARKEFDKKQATWQANVDTLTNDVQNAIKTYEKSAALGTEKERQLAKERSEEHTSELQSRL